MTKARKGSALTKVLLGIFFAFGSLIIIAAAFVLMNFLLADNIDTNRLTDSYKDYLSVYEEYPSMRDLPEGMEIVSSTCKVRDNIFTYSLKIRNTGPVMAEYALQLYYSEEFMELKPKVRNPFIREYSDDGLLILSDEVKEFTVTGTISRDMSIDEFKAAMDHVYLEVIYNGFPGRVMLPVSLLEG